MSSQWQSLWQFNFNSMQLTVTLRGLILWNFMPLEHIFFSDLLISSNYLIIMVHFTEEQYLQFEQAIRVAMEQRDHEADPDSDSESLPDPELMEIKVL